MGGFNQKVYRRCMVSSKVTAILLKKWKFNFISFWEHFLDHLHRVFFLLWNILENDSLEKISESKSGARKNGNLGFELGKETYCAHNSFNSRGSSWHCAEGKGYSRQLWSHCFVIRSDKLVPCYKTKKDACRISQLNSSFSKSWNF